MIYTYPKTVESSGSLESSITMVGISLITFKSSNPSTIGCHTSSILKYFENYK